jgi:hypothetical protein
MVRRSAVAMAGGGEELGGWVDHGMLIKGRGSTTTFILGYTATG